MTVSARTRLLVIVLATALATAGLAAAASTTAAQVARPRGQAGVHQLRGVKL